MTNLHPTALGLIAGAGLGILIFALTGNVMWTVYAAAAGTLIGAVVASNRSSGAHKAKRG